MPKWQYRLISTLLYLDRIPRYGRIYRMHPIGHKSYTMHWEWQWHGHWGFNVCDRHFPKMFWRYVDEVAGIAEEDPEDSKDQRSPANYYIHEIFNNGYWRAELNFRRKVLGAWPKTYQSVDRFCVHRRVP